MPATRSLNVCEMTRRSSSSREAPQAPSPPGGGACSVLRSDRLARLRDQPRSQLFGQAQPLKDDLVDELLDHLIPLVVCGKERADALSCRDRREDFNDRPLSHDSSVPRAQTFLTSEADVTRPAPPSFRFRVRQESCAGNGGAAINASVFLSVFLGVMIVGVAAAVVAFVFGLAARRSRDDASPGATEHAEALSGSPDEAAS